MDRRTQELWVRKGWDRPGLMAMLSITVLLALLVGCSSNQSQSPASNKSGSVSQPSPVVKLSPNVPEIVRVQAPEPFTGGARFAIDEASLDYGKVKLEDWVQAAFHVKNVGDAPLVITGDPLVRVVEGC